MQHWLEGQIQQLIILAGRDTRGTETGPYLRALREAVELIATCEGVTAAFGSHDGLVFQIAGSVPDPDALAAVAQAALTCAKETALAAALGRPEQMVIIGKDHKLALFPVGPIAIGILAPATVNLARVLEKSPPPPQKGAPSMTRSLLAQVGGREAVEVVVSLFYDRLLQDAELAPFFRDVSMNRLRQLQTDFFVAALDGQPWRGRDLKAVHAGMRITDRHFDRTAQHLRAAMEQAGVPLTQLEQIIGLIATLRPQIVAGLSRETSGPSDPEGARS